MGCSGSKLEEQRAVVLCRGRVELLAAAIRHREALGAAHAAYSDSLLSVSGALHRVLLLVPTSSSSPILPLPARRKTDPSPLPPVVSSARPTHPSSQLKFASPDFDSDDDDDDDEEDEDSPLYSPGIPPAHHLHHYGAIPRGPGFGSIYYARSQPPPPPVSVEQRRPSHETVQSSSIDPYAATYPSYGYPYASFPDYFGSMGGLLGPSSAPPAMPSPAATTASAFGGSSSSWAPPPPPSPPKTSTWDFLNPFNTYSNYYHHYTPSRSSREVRDEEGIPDLEEIDQEEEKEAYGDQNGWTSSSSDGSYYHHSRSVAADRRSKVEPEVIDSNLTMAKECKRTQIRQQNACEVADTIKIQFQKASQCFAEFSVLLEVENYWYQSRHCPSDEGYKVMESRGLASTLQKLHVWERKLHHEVRAEEKMRLLLSKSHKELNYLLEKGAEDGKIEFTRNLIDKLSTKIRIAIRVVGSVSRKINMLRDEELWPRIAELALGSASMWNVMLECHRMQYRSILEAKRLDLVISGRNFSGGHADEIMQLEMEMLKWSSNFSAWINAQRNCVKALNGWLLLCLHREPGAASDVSPRRMGAPPVFIICNSWSQAIDRTSEKPVLDAMQDFAAALHHLWGQQMGEQNERMAAIRDRDRWLRAIEKKKKDMHKVVDSVNKKLAVVPARFRPPMADHRVVFEGRDTARFSSSPQLGLEKIFEAMEDFSASSVKAYQELLEHCGHHTD